MESLGEQIAWCCLFVQHLFSWAIIFWKSSHVDENSGKWRQPIHIYSQIVKLKKKSRLQSVISIDALILTRYTHLSTGYSCLLSEVRILQSSYEYLEEIKYGWLIRYYQSSLVIKNIQISKC